jgi:hypothetical protein
MGRLSISLLTMRLMRLTRNSSASRSFSLKGTHSFISEMPITLEQFRKSICGEAESQLKQRFENCRVNAKYGTK